MKAVAGKREASVRLDPTKLRLGVFEVTLHGPRVIFFLVRFQPDDYRSQLFQVTGALVEWVSRT